MKWCVRALTPTAVGAPWWRTDYVVLSELLPVTAGDRMGRMDRMTKMTPTAARSLAPAA